MRLVKLANGRTIPQIGYGVGTAWFKRSADVPFSPECVASVQEALKAGFRHLDMAEMYGTDEEVAQALKALPQLGLDRRDLFITSKLFKSLLEGAAQPTEKIIQHLGVGHLDLLLIHAPFFEMVNSQVPGTHVDLEKVWREMEGLVDAGKVSSIGVSNFRIEDLQKILAFARIKPIVNQIEFHPYIQQPELMAFCKEHDITLAGYSGLMPLTGKQGGPVDAVVAEIAKAKGLTESQVLLMWSMQQGVVAITTSGKQERMHEYLAAACAVSGQQLPEGSGAAGCGAGLPCLSEEEIVRISEAGRQMPFRKYWQKQFGFEPLER